MRVHHRVDGDGERVVVFSNSLGSTTELWAAQARALAPHARVVRYDHRGHDGSPLAAEPFDVADLAGDVLELADTLGVERFSFVGVSLGGAVGQWLGANAPERLDRLVLACTSARFGEPDSWRDRAATVRTSGIEAIAEAVVARWFTPTMDVLTTVRFRAMLEGTPAEGYAACCDALARWDFRADLPRVAVPTLVVAGADDPSQPVSASETIAAAVPGARLLVLDGAAHLANVEQPAAFTHALFDHLGLAVAA